MLAMLRVRKEGAEMSQDTQALIEQFIADYAGARETKFRGRLAEILSQYGAEIEQRTLPV